MRARTVTRAIGVLGTMTVVALLAVLALPWIASTQIVRDRIAYELSVWSGYRVSLGEAPALDVWPRFTATLNDVAFHEWSGGGRLPVLEADSLEVSMSALSALGGRVVLSGVVMQRPLLRLAGGDAIVDLPASPGGGRMVRAVDTARKIVADNPANPDRSALPADSFGTVEFANGRIVGQDGADIVTSLNGRIAWPSLNRPAALNATGIWRGENVAVEGTSAQPLMLLAGGSSGVTASIRSPLLEGSFNGVASLAQNAFFEGQARLSSPSLKRLLEWSQTPIGPGAAIGAVAVSGKIQGSVNRLRVDGVELRLGDDIGKGVLDVAVTDRVPAIAGTLAFDKLDLRSFLGALTLIPPTAAGSDTPIDIGFARQIALDLRLSAARATLGQNVLTDLAASTQVKNDLAVFDISDASAFGGSLQAGVRIEAGGDGSTVEFRAMLDDVDAFAAAKAAGAESMVPEGRANISIILKGSGTTWQAALAGAQGSVSATLGQGALVGLDLAAFKQRWSKGDFFALQEVGKGKIPFRAVDFKARVVGGVARIEKADLLMEREAISFAGIIPYFGRALALSGHFVALAADGTRGERQAPFFIGGGWDTPVVSPVTQSGMFE